MARRPPRLLATAALALASLAAAPAPPAPKPAPRPDVSTVVQELEVRGHPLAPPMWRVSKGDSQVVIFGVAKPLTHMQTWDTKPLERALDEATAVLLPPKPRLGVMDMIGLKITGGGLKQPRGRTLSSTLPPPLRAKFLAEAQRIKQDPKKYEGWKGAVAGGLLLADFRAAAGLSEAKPESTVEHLAEQHGIPTRRIADYKVSSKTLGGLSDAANLSCFQDAIEELDSEGEVPDALGKAWAVGDLEGVREHYTAWRIERCLQQAPSYAGLLEQGTGETTKEVLSALGQPGKTIVLVDISLLLRPNGVLDRLKAQGAAIAVEGP